MNNKKLMECITAFIELNIVKEDQPELFPEHEDKLTIQELNTLAKLFLQQQTEESIEPFQVGLGLTFIEIMKDENDEYIKEMVEKGHEIDSKVFDLTNKLN